MTAADKLERFSAGERFAVDPDAIERELASLWRAAGASTDSTKNPVTRACLWNVIVHIEQRPKLEGSSEADELGKVLRDLPQYIAARALVLRTMPDAQGSPELESWISANCIVAGGGGKLVCSEEVAIAARGDGERHLPALTRALLVPAVPTAVVFAGAPPSERPAMEALIGAANRIVVHADRSLMPRPLDRIAAVMSEVPLGAIDLGWIELSTYRGLVASLFDPPSAPEDLAAIDSIIFAAGPKHRWSGQLMLAWIAEALGGENPKPLGHHAWRFTRPGGRAFEAIFAETPNLDRPAITLSASSTKATYAVKPLQDNLAEVTGPNIDSRKMLGRRSMAQLLARALRTRSDDRGFSRALKLAGAM